MRALALLLAAATSTAAADYKIVRATSIDNGGKQQQTEYWTSRRVVIDDPSQRTIVDFEAGTATVADKDARTFMKIKLEDLRRALNAADTIMEHLPEAARDALGVGRTLSIADTGDFATIADRRAREYRIAGENVVGSVWLAEDLDPRAILGNEASEWLRSGGPLRAIGPLGDVLRGIERANVKGMPVWVWLSLGSADGETTITSEVASIAEDRSPADIARVPPGYHERTVGILQ